MSMQKHSKWLDGLIKYTVAAILIAVPLYPKFPFLRIPGTFVSIRLEDFLIVFASIILALIYIPKIGNLIEKPLYKAITSFLLVGLVSVFSGVFLTQTVVPHIGLLHWFRRIEYFIPLFLGIEAIHRDRENLIFYFKILLIVVFFVFIYGFGQKSLGWPIIITQNEEYSKGVALRWIAGSHINSTFAGHYDLATFLVLILPIIVSSFFILNGIWMKITLATVTFSGLWLLVNTASRVSLVSYLFSTILSLILIKKYKAIPIVLVISLIFVGFSSNLLVRYGRIIEVFKGRVGNFHQINLGLDVNSAYAQDNFDIKRDKVTPTPTPQLVFEDRSTNIRLNVEWPRALRAFFKNPLLGTGYSSITLATDNDYLRLLGELGILGTLAFITILVRIGVPLLRVFPLTKYFKDIELIFLAGVSGSLPGILTNAIFIDIFEASKFAMIFWLIIGFTVSLAEKRSNEDNI